MTQSNDWRETGRFRGPMGHTAFMQAVDCAAAIMRATPADGPIPGLWSAPGYPELTTNQLVEIGARKSLERR
jgi:hypothetical protein